MHDSTQSINQLGFWKRFTAALIDGIILNTSLEIILRIITSAIGQVNLPDFDTANFELILGLVYFAALDSLPTQVSVGKKLVEVKFELILNSKIISEFTNNYLFKLISIVALF